MAPVLAVRVVAQHVGAVHERVDLAGEEAFDSRRTVGVHTRRDPFSLQEARGGGAFDRSDARVAEARRSLDPAELDDGELGGV